MYYGLHTFTKVGIFIALRCNACVYIVYIVCIFYSELRFLSYATSVLYMSENVPVFPMATQYNYSAQMC